MSFLFFSRGFIQIHFGLFDFFVFVLSKKYHLSKLMLLDSCCQKTSFLCKDNFCIDEKRTQWHWDTKVKAFHESISWFMKCPWNCISWNALKEKFHSVSFPLSFWSFDCKHQCVEGKFACMVNGIKCKDLCSPKKCDNRSLEWVVEDEDD